MPELEAWRAQSEIKTALLAETGGGESFVARAADTLYPALLAATLEQRPGTERTPLQRLFDKGYDPRLLAESFACAWLEEADCLYLPRRRALDSFLITVGVPVTLAVIVISVIMTILLRQHADWLGPFIYFSGLLMIPGAALAWLLMRVWRVFLQGLETITPTPSRVVNISMSLHAQDLMHAHEGVVCAATDDEFAVDVVSIALAIDLDTFITSIPQHVFGDLFETSDRYFSAMNEPQTQTITIDGVEYSLNSLSDAAKQQLANLRVCDQEIQRLNMQLAITQTARAAYAKALQEVLPKTLS